MQDALRLLESMVVWRPRFAQEAELLLSSIEPQELLDLEDIFSRMTYYGFVEHHGVLEWNNLIPEQVASLAADSPCRTSVLGLLSFHRNGYVRHEAVRW